jgi:PIN domain nuclease of toxin-antitoxin system
MGPESAGNRVVVSVTVDSHALIWYMQESRRLSSRARKALERADTIVIPCICCWEIAMLANEGKITLGVGSPIRWFQAVAERGDFELAMITPEVGAESVNVGRQFGLDPGDQLIAATAIVRRLPLVTRDARLQGLARLETIW